MLRRALAAAGIVCVVFAGITAVALEGREVVVLRTAGAARVHETRTWIVDEGETALVEAANPERPFLRDVQANPAVEVRRAGAVRHCRAIPLPNPDGHAIVRRLLAEKYGWADRWIARLTDTSRSVAVRVECP